MAEKDLAAKYLESYNDVFADIVNVLLYQGETIICKDQLTEAETETQYKTDGQVHQQIRDIAKYWKNHAKIALLGIENQITVDKNMVLRVLGYDGASYRNQLNRAKANDIESTGTMPDSSFKCTDDHTLYPVITIVLYFGSTHWNAPTTLHERILIPDILKKYVNDYQIHVFEIAYLTDEQLQLFTSDFKIIADYFIQKRKAQDYVPSSDTILHIDAVLQMLHALTGDNRFETIYQYQEGEKVTMGEVLLDRIENRGIEKGIREGKLTIAARLLTDGTLTIDKIADYCQLSVEEVEELAKQNG